MPYFKYLSYEPLKKLCDKLRSVDFVKKDIIFKRDEAADYLYIIYNGEVTYINLFKKVHKIYKFNQVFGTGALEERGKRTYKAVVTSDEVQCLRLHKDDYDRCLFAIRVSEI